MNKGQIQIGQFLRVFSETLGLKKTALLSLSSFESVDKEQMQFDETLAELNKEYEKKFDMVFADLPFGMRREPFIYDENRKVNQSWNILTKGLEKINPNGTLFAVIEPAVYFSKQGKDFLVALETKGYFANLFLNAPEKLYQPKTAFNPIIIGFQNHKTDTLFIAEIDNENPLLIANNFKEKKGDNIQNGKWVDRKTFVTFQKAKIENEIGGLQTQYKDYRHYRLSEVAICINLTRESFNDLPNSVYIPKIGTSKVVSSINDIRIKHQNIFQIQLDPELVLSEYLALFYESDLGQLILSSLSTGSFIPNITKSNIEDSQLAIPPIAEQKILIHTNQKLKELQDTVNELKSELSLNPKSANTILEKFDSIVSPLKKLSSEDEILSLIRKGENKKSEFKQTFSKNVHTSKKDKEIEKSSLKNIVGFLNAEGGTLLIGVADNGEITGVEDDFFKSNDKYLLNFKNALNTKIGSEFYPLIDFDLFQVLDKHVLRVTCKPSKKACFYDGNEFYVRTNPATDKLEGRQLIEYVKRRFKE
ncbi:RNA-binding domain-containing protein [Crocinitomix algicola]|uniref:RNA-binding domain-containing protein n=1 Tax=Crocinitomix algicola TaxID=1740263 RepID=UPI00082E6058|nr:RNA-binding domain-containing protein [Crocinitomix algicola]